MRRRRRGTCGWCRRRRRPRSSCGVTNSDLAFTGKYAIQGNYNGFQVFDISNPVKPVPVLTYLCPASQSDVSVYKNLLFVSGEGQTGRVDCGIQGVPEPVSKERLRGIRIFDITDIAHPKYVANVQTCRGSHTHTVVTDPKDKDNVYIYVSGLGAACARPRSCPAARTVRSTIPNTARFRLEVIKVPLAAPEKAAIVSSPRIFYDLAPPPRRVEPGRGGARRRRRCACRRRRAAGCSRRLRVRRRWRAAARRAARRRRAPPAGAAGGGRGGAARRSAAPTPGRISATTSRSIRTSASPAARAAATACCSTSRDVAQPEAHRRSGRHQHVVLALGDVQQRRHQDPLLRRVGRRLAAALPRHRQAGVGRRRALHASRSNKMRFKSYYKMPAAQTAFENCVAHNGSLIPIPGRDVMVQAWYQGGISVFDWTDVAKPKEIAYFDRGPMDADPAGQRRLVVGLLVQRPDRQLGDRARPRHLRAAAERLISQNEIDAAKTVQVGLPERAGAARRSCGRRASRRRAPISISSNATRGSKRSGSPRRGRRSPARRRARPPPSERRSHGWLASWRRTRRPRRTRPRSAR